MVDKKESLKQAISDAGNKKKTATFKGAALNVMDRLREHGMIIKSKESEHVA